MIFVLSRFKWAIGLTIAYIVKISPTICTHKIKVEPKCVPNVENHLYFNLTIEEVVNNEIIKWLDVGAVYLIFNSK